MKKILQMGKDVKARRKMVDETPVKLQGAFNQLINRIKRFGECWSEKILLKWLRVNPYKV